MSRIRIGTRGSRLALKQAELLQEAIRRADGQAETELVILHTKGDKILDRPLAEIGDKGLFVSEFERALSEEQIDLAVHSAKDLPMRLAEGLEIAAVLPRADVREVLAVRRGAAAPRRAVRNVVLEEREAAARDVAAGGETAAVRGAEAGRKSTMPDAAAGREAAAQEGRASGGSGAAAPAECFRLGTGSRRRQAQACGLWENVSCLLIRGNVETRLKKLEDGGYDGILLAKAGLDRLNINRETDGRFEFHALCPEIFLPAACQGIIAVEARTGSEWKPLLSRISDEETWLSFLTERAVLEALEADCSEAAAAWCRRRDGGILLDVMYGEERVSLSGKATPEDARALARRAAEAVKGGSGGSGGRTGWPKR